MTIESVAIVIAGLVVLLLLGLMVSELFRGEDS